MERTNKTSIKDSKPQIKDEFQEIFNQSPIGILFHDKEGIAVNANDSALKIMAISKLDDVLGINLFDNPFIAEKKDELTDKGIIKFQAPLNLEKIKELGFYYPTKKGVLFLDYTVSVTDSGFLVQIQDITERKKAEEEIDRRNMLLDGINKVFQESLIGETEEEVAVTCLNVANMITKSKFGFVGLINTNGNMDTIAIDKTGWKMCNAPFKEALKLTRNMKVQSYWGRVIKEEKSQIVNDTSSDLDRRGVPEGHPPVNLFLGVPFKQAGETIGLIGLANKEGGYTEEDKNDIETLSVAFVEALMRKKAEIHLKETLDNLELKVRERTLKLKKSEDEIKRKNRILDGINAIFRAAIINSSEEEFGKICLAVCEELTNSEFSFIGGINEKGRFDSIAVSERGWQACNMVKVQGPESVNDNVIRGIRSRALKEKKIVIFNDPVNSPYWSCLPDGHYPINSFMGAPLIYRDKVIGLIALANKKSGYSKEDMEVMEVITTAITESLMHYRALKQLEENQKELKETITELERSNQELESFAYITSHDLQEPLRTIASFTQLLERRYKGQLDNDADEFMDYIVIAAVRMKAMIQGLLDYSRVGKDEELNEFNAEEALNQTLSNMHSSIEECHADVTHENLPVIVTDKKQIARVFQNLIGNALKFRKEEIKPKIHVSAEKIGNEYIFSVQDNGIGIEEQYMGRIFDVFKRLHTMDEYQGTGIGLAVVKRIVERHGGRVWVESELGVGSTFYFTIPVEPVKSDGDS